MMLYSPLVPYTSTKTLTAAIASLELSPQADIFAGITIEPEVDVTPVAEEEDTEQVCTAGLFPTPSAM